MGGKSQQKPPAYPLSLKDLCVLPFLPELMDAKIDSFKIEGRMKSPEYVAGVTAIYRKYMDLYLTDREHWQIDPKDQELLAPAGTMDCLKAAIAAGADAVYLGGQRFGARAFAGNFSREELLEGLSLAHLWNRKIYLTVNTLTKQDELSGLCDWIAPFYEAGLDGVIVQDMGVLEKLRKNFPGMELHASTQMTVTESRSALFLKSLGVCRIVPARELSLEEIRLLKEQTGLAMEVFIHGALCYCYSGQCLFSSFLGGRSGNRGRCAQPCRQPLSLIHI